MSTDREITEYPASATGDASTLRTYWSTKTPGEDMLGFLQGRVRGKIEILQLMGSTDYVIVVRADTTLNMQQNSYWSDLYGLPLFGTVMLVPTTLLTFTQ
jgi:hypothetical protein